MPTVASSHADRAESGARVCEVLGRAMVGPGRLFAPQSQCDTDPAVAGLAVVSDAPNPPEPATVLTGAFGGSRAADAGWVPVTAPTSNLGD